MVWRHTATELVDLLRRGELTSEEIVRGLQARADVVQPKVNAFTEQHREAAITRARSLDRARQNGEALGDLHLFARASSRQSGACTRYGDASATSLERGIPPSPTALPQPLPHQNERTHAPLGCASRP